MCINTITINTMKIENLFNFNNKNIKSKIISYGISLFAIIFVGYLLISAIDHYILKYLF
jgi:hypothetical protein